ncbi:MAG TPA: DUF6600 domain-containing protein, partial [Vicinamibacteria bacterium]|nr:DUF6600 domain-containing protein [Vicinamibacteria bacterium]
GTWHNGGAEGYVWTPNVAAGWQPYSNGQWAWTPYGWTWVPYESWGWAPFHYGRWGFSASFGWYWAPGRTWGPAWVSWAVGDGYVGWCPLGRYDRPVTPWGANRAYAAPRAGFRGYDAWHVVRRAELGGHGLGRRLVPVDRIDPTAFRVADNAVLRPTRDATSLRAGDAGPRAISRRQTMGDFVRELQVDNKTTIPAPWTRGYGPPAAGAEGARYGAPHPTDRGGEEKESRNGTASRGTGTAAPGTAATPRPASQYTPPPSTNASGGRSNEARPSSSGGAQQRQSRRADPIGGWAGQRSGNPNAVPRRGGVSSDRSRSEGNGASRSHAESAAPRPSGSGNSPAGGGASGSSHGSGHASTRGNRG